MVAVVVSALGNGLAAGVALVIIGIVALGDSLAADVALVVISVVALAQGFTAEVTLVIIVGILAVDLQLAINDDIALNNYHVGDGTAHIRTVSGGDVVQSDGDAFHTAAAGTGVDTHTAVVVRLVIAGGDHNVGQSSVLVEADQVVVTAGKGSISDDDFLNSTAEAGPAGDLTVVDDHVADAAAAIEVDTVGAAGDSTVLQSDVAVAGVAVTQAVAAGDGAVLNQDVATVDDHGITGGVADGNVLQSDAVAGERNLAVDHDIALAHDGDSLVDGHIAGVGAFADNDGVAGYGSLDGVIQSCITLSADVNGVVGSCDPLAVKLNSLIAGGDVAGDHFAVQSGSVDGDADGPLGGAGGDEQVHITVQNSAAVDGQSTGVGLGAGIVEEDGLIGALDDTAVDGQNVLGLNAVQELTDSAVGGLDGTAVDDGLSIGALTVGQVVDAVGHVSAAQMLDGAGLHGQLTAGIVGNDGGVTAPTAVNAGGQGEHAVAGDGQVTAVIEDAEVRGGVVDTGDGVTVHVQDNGGACGNGNDGIQGDVAQNEDMTAGIDSVLQSGIVDAVNGSNGSPGLENGDAVHNNSDVIVGLGLVVLLVVPQGVAADVAGAETGDSGIIDGQADAGSEAGVHLDGSLAVHSGGSDEFTIGEGDIVEQTCALGINQHGLAGAVEGTAVEYNNLSTVGPDVVISGGLVEGTVVEGLAGTVQEHLTVEGTVVVNQVAGVLQTLVGGAAGIGEGNIIKGDVSAAEVLCVDAGELNTVHATGDGEVLAGGAQSIGAGSEDLNFVAGLSGIEGVSQGGVVVVADLGCCGSNSPDTVLFGSGEALSDKSAGIGTEGTAGDEAGQVAAFSGLEVIDSADVAIGDGAGEVGAGLEVDTADGAAVDSQAANNILGVGSAGAVTGILHPDGADIAAVDGDGVALGQVVAELADAIIVVAFGNDLAAVDGQNSVVGGGVVVDAVADLAAVAGILDGYVIYGKDSGVGDGVHCVAGGSRQSALTNDGAVVDGEVAIVEDDSISSSGLGRAGDSVAVQIQNDGLTCSDGQGVLQSDVSQNGDGVAGGDVGHSGFQSTIVLIADAGGNSEHGGGGLLLVDSANHCGDIDVVSIHIGHGDAAGLGHSTGSDTDGVLPVLMSGGQSDIVHVAVGNDAAVQQDAGHAANRAVGSDISAAHGTAGDGGLAAGVADDDTYVGAAVDAGVGDFTVRNGQAANIGIANDGAGAVNAGGIDGDIGNGDVLDDAVGVISEANQRAGVVAGELANVDLNIHQVQVSDLGFAIDSAEQTGAEVAIALGSALVGGQVADGVVLTVEDAVEGGIAVIADVDGPVDTEQIDVGGQSDPNAGGIVLGLAGIDAVTEEDQVADVVDQVGVGLGAAAHQAGLGNEVGAVQIQVVGQTVGQSNGSAALSLFGEHAALDGAGQSGSAAGADLGGKVTVSHSQTNSLAAVVDEDGGAVHTAGSEAAAVDGDGSSLTEGLHPDLTLEGTVVDGQSTAVDADGAVAGSADDTVVDGDGSTGMLDSAVHMDSGTVAVMIAQVLDGAVVDNQSAVVTDGVGTPGESGVAFANVGEADDTVAGDGQRTVVLDHLIVSGACLLLADGVAVQVQDNIAVCGNNQSVLQGNVAQNEDITAGVNSVLQGEIVGISGERGNGRVVVVVAADLRLGCVAVEEGELAGGDGADNGTDIGGGADAYITVNGAVADLNTLQGNAGDAAGGIAATFNMGVRHRAVADGGVGVGVADDAADEAVAVDLGVADGAVVDQIQLSVVAVTHDAANAVGAGGVNSRIGNGDIADLGVAVLVVGKAYQDANVVTFFRGGDVEAVNHQVTDHSVAVDVAEQTAADVAGVVGIGFDGQTADGVAVAFEATVKRPVVTVANAFVPNFAGQVDVIGQSDPDVGGIVLGLATVDALLEQVEVFSGVDQVGRSLRTLTGETDDGLNAHVRGGRINFGVHRIGGIVNNAVDYSRIFADVVDAIYSVIVGCEGVDRDHRDDHHDGQEQGKCLFLEQCHFSFSF